MAVPNFNYVLNFLDQVKQVYCYKPKKFRRLQLLWLNYLKKNINFICLLNDLSGLLSDDPILVEGFNKLLPTEFKLKIPELKRRSNCRNDSPSDEPSTKKQKIQDDNYSMYGSWKEFSFFDQVRRMFGNESIYLNFLRCLGLFNENLIDGVELLETLNPFISKSPSLLAQLKSMLQHHLDGRSTTRQMKHPSSLAEEIRKYEIDFSSCRKMGSSYRALKTEPDNEPVCSGRTDLCKSVLNDIWVSFPLWSEDPASTSESQGGCKITSIQEFFYKCEDERFELDIVIDQVSSTIKILEEVQNKMAAMSQEELVAFRLDDSLGGSSQVLQKKVIERIYGDKAKDLLDGLKMKPFIGVPIALRRLRSKQQEWMEHKIKFNKIWKDNTEKHSQRSINCELASVKQNDHKDARSKVIINESEAIHEESCMLSSIYGSNCSMKGNQFNYSDEEAFKDLNDLIYFNLDRLSEDQWTPDRVGNGSSANPVANSTSSLSSCDKNIISFCKRALAIINLLSGAQNGGSDPLLNPGDNSIFSTAMPSHNIDISNHRANHPHIGHPNQPEPSAAPDEVVMYQTSKWLVLISLHHKLYTRLSKIRAASQKELLNRRNALLETSSRRKSKTIYLDFNGKDDCNTLYSFALTVLKSCVRGACESSAYEEHVRKVMAKVRSEGSFNYNDVSYWIISLDKLLKNAVRELQQLAGDESTQKGIELFETYHQQNNSPLIGSTVHMTYRHKSLDLLLKDFCYKFTFKKRWHKINTELLDLSNGGFLMDGATKIHKMQTWQEYINNFLLSNTSTVNSMPFLKRNLRREVPNDMVFSGSDEIFFRRNSFKIAFSAFSHSVLKRSSGIQTDWEKLKRQALNRHGKFLFVWYKWQVSHITPLHEQRFLDWMLGMKKNQTKVSEVSQINVPPFRSYRKYITKSCL